MSRLEVLKQHTTIVDADKLVQWNLSIMVTHGTKLSGYN